MANTSDQDAMSTFFANLLKKQEESFQNALTTALKTQADTFTHALTTQSANFTNALNAQHQAIINQVKEMTNTTASLPPTHVEPTPTQAGTSYGPTFSPPPIIDLTDKGKAPDTPTSLPLDLNATVPSPATNPFQSEGFSSFPEAKKLMEKFEAMERTLKNIKKHEDMIDVDSLALFPNARVPPKFKMPIMDKFNGTTCPKTHLKMYVGAMRPFGVDNELLAQLFQQSLTGAAVKWLLDLDQNHKKSWDDICNAFVKQYHYNIEVDVTRRDLETTKQRSGESFTAFLTRWRTKAAQMVKRPSEEEQIDIIIKNLLPQYQVHLQIQYLADFRALIATATKIEDLIQSGRIKDESSNSRYHKNNNYNTTTQRGGEVNAVSSHQPMRLESRRTFSELGMPLSVVYKKAMEANLIKPLEPRAPPNPLPKGYNANEHCDYHREAGHKTDACKALRHRIQDLIDNGDIVVPRPKPNISTNPLPNH